MLQWSLAIFNIKSSLLVLVPKAIQDLTPEQMRPVLTVKVSSLTAMTAFLTRETLSVLDATLSTSFSQLTIQLANLNRLDAELIALSSQTD